MTQPRRWRVAPVAPTVALRAVSLGGIVLFSGMLWAVPRAAGDTLELRSGGRIEGRLVNPDQVPRTSYKIQLQAGGHISVPARQVAKLVARNPDQEEYGRIAPTFADTVEDQWRLAEWCRERHLSVRSTHLARILELDPDHVRARRALGYQQHDGRWMTRDEIMISRGLVKYKGHWRYRQEVESIERKEATTKVQKQWKGRLRRMREALDTSSAEQAVEAIRAITDPAAFVALRAALVEDPDPDRRRLYAEGLAGIASGEALRTLVDLSLEDPAEEVRLTAIDFLAAAADPHVVPIYIEALTSDENYVINRAAIALAQLSDPAAVGPLIDSLVTTHTRVVVEGGGGSFSPSFGNVDGKPVTGFSAGTSRKKIVRHAANQDVLNTLIKLTGVNFNFDVGAWRDWHANQRAAARTNTRRD